MRGGLEMTAPTMSTELKEAGRRAFDEIVLHKLALGIEAFGKWIAVNLSDGRSDHVLYDSRGDAVRHQHGCERDRAYIPVKPGSIDPLELAAFIGVSRKMRAAGIAIPDVDHRNGGLDVIQRTSARDQYAQLRNMFRGDNIPSNLIIPGIGVFE